MQKTSEGSAALQVSAPALLANNRLGCKVSYVTDALAYLISASEAKKKSLFTTSTAGSSRRRRPSEPSEYLVVVERRLLPRTEFRFFEYPLEPAEGEDGGEEEDEEVRGRAAAVPDV